MDINELRKQARRQARAARAMAKLVADNPGMVKDLVAGLLPGGAASPAVEADHDHVIPDVIAGHDRVVSGTAYSGAAPEQVRRFVDDLALLPQWLTLHAGWRGEPPATAYVGATFEQQLKIMGIPAQVSWTVAQADDDAVIIDGVGPMGLGLGLCFTVRTVPTGSRVRVDAGMSGDPIKGPLGGSVARSVQEAMEESLAHLVASLADGVEGAAAGAAPVLHHASGRRLDPRTPVIVGVGQVVQREPRAPYVEPAELAAQALRNAAADAGVPDLAARADAVYGVATASWLYNDQAAVVAAKLGASPAETLQTARFGGDGGQLAINTAGQAVADGRASIVLVFGAEAGASLAAAQKNGESPAWTEQDPTVRPSRTVGSDREANTELEGQVGLGMPVYNYALMESALRARSGESPAEHTRTITELWSGLSQVAAANEYAWLPQAFTATELATVTPDNRMVTTPYPKLLCANLQVDLASGLIVTSVAAAEAAGVPQEKWVFLHAGAAAYDDWFVSERGELDASPAIRTIGAAALAHAGLGIDEIEHVDLYACFPAAVQIGARELGLPINDPARPLSVTGGLTFAGGPGNNYGGHAVATLVQRLREDPTAYGLSTSLGWYVTKHALGIYSAQPPTRLFEALTPVVTPRPTRPVLVRATGSAVVEAYTTQYGRSGEPEAVILTAITADGSRALARTKQAEVVAAFTEGDALGWTITLDGNEVTLVSTERSPVPPPPEMTVLTEDRGPVRIITINRPHARNAIDLATAELMERVVDDFEADPSVRVAVITGAGGTFCAGMDLKAAATGQFPLTERRGPLGITGAPITKPVIAAVEGHALAGGCEIALVADLIVASTTSQFGIPEPKRGLAAAAGGVLRLTQRLPRNIAMELALTGDPMPATRLAELGLVNVLAKPGKVLGAALDLAGRIAVNAPISIEVSKEIVVSSPDWTLAEAFDRQTELASRAVLSEDAGEGVRAFAEKRDPVWQGR